MRRSATLRAAGVQLRREKSRRALSVARHLSRVTHHNVTQLPTKVIKKELRDLAWKQKET